MIKASVINHIFRFCFPAATSRGTMLEKPVYFLILYHVDHPEIQGIGECSLFQGLSYDDRDDFDQILLKYTHDINRGSVDPHENLPDFPSINFARETAIADLANQGNKIWYPSLFTRGNDHIRINGLIWMGKKEEMHKQIRDKLEQGFRCLKLKIGSLDFDIEFSLLKEIRKKYTADQLEIRLDANGAFSPGDANKIIARLAELKVHSIEQPIKSSQHEEMAMLCINSPIAVALDEELIGMKTRVQKRKILDSIRPHYIVLKPGLLGGIESCEEWIELAQQQDIGWWITSSLETNIGLNRIAQWTYTLKNSIAQGLGTGNIFENNIPSPLALAGENLYYSEKIKWDLSLFKTNYADHGK